MTAKKRHPELSKVTHPRKGAPSLRHEPDCEQAIGPAFHEFVDLAVAAGWQELDVIVALRNLADAEIAFSLRSDEGTPSLATAAMPSSRQH